MTEFEKCLALLNAMNDLGNLKVFNARQMNPIRSGLNRSFKVGVHAPQDLRGPETIEEYLDLTEENYRRFVDLAQLESEYLLAIANLQKRTWQNGVLDALYATEPSKAL